MQEKNQPNQFLRSMTGFGKMLICLLTLCVLNGHSNFVLANSTYAEAAATIKVSGLVTDESNHPLAGASVLVKKTNKAVATDANGRFAFEVNEGAVLVISSIGFLTQEIAATTGMITVKLKEDIKQLEEVTIGYQRLRKSDLTGSISSVKASELNLSSPTLSQALVGKIAGVQVSQVSGAPYSGAKLRVRGIGSINASSEPYTLAAKPPLI